MVASTSCVCGSDEELVNQDASANLSRKNVLGRLFDDAHGECSCHSAETVPLVAK